MHKIIFSRFGYERSVVEFYLVLKESTRSMTVEKVGLIEVARDALSGAVFPDLNERTGEIYRVLKRNVNGSIALFSSFGRGAGHVVNAHEYFEGEAVRYSLN